MSAPDLAAPGAVLAELNHLRKLYLEVVDRIDRIEDAEELRGLSGRFRDAYAKHLTGDNDGAVALLRADMEDEP